MLTHGGTLDEDILPTIVQDAIHHAVIIFQLHFRIFQGLIGKKTMQFLKAEAVYIVSADCAIHLKRYHIAYGQAVTKEILRSIHGLFEIDGVEDFQLVALFQQQPAALYNDAALGVSDHIAGMALKEI